MLDCMKSMQALQATGQREAPTVSHCEDLGNIYTCPYVQYWLHSPLVAGHTPSIQQLNTQGTSQGSSECTAHSRRHLTTLWHALYGLRVSASLAVAGRLGPSLYVTETELSMLSVWCAHFAGKTRESPGSSTASSAATCCTRQSWQRS